MRMMGMLPCVIDNAARPLDSQPGEHFVDLLRAGVVHVLGHAPRQNAGASNGPLPRYPAGNPFNVGAIRPIDVIHGSLLWRQHSTNLAIWVSSPKWGGLPWRSDRPPRGVIRTGPTEFAVLSLSSAIRGHAPINSRINASRTSLWVRTPIVVRGIGNPSPLVQG